MNTAPLRSALPRRIAAGAAAAAMLAVPALAGASVRAHHASVSTVNIRTVSGKGYLAGANGHSLYEFSKDTKSRSNCTGACLKAWSPYTTTGIPTAGAGLSAKLGTITTGGKKQVVYDGHPLYTYRKDTKVGQFGGEALVYKGGDFYLLKTTGAPEACAPGTPCTY